LACTATAASPSIGSDGAIYIANNNGSVIALNRSGSQRWRSVVYEGTKAHVWVQRDDGLMKLRQRTLEAAVVPDGEELLVAAFSEGGLGAGDRA